MGHQVSVSHEASPPAYLGTQLVKNIGIYIETLPIVHSIDPKRGKMTMRLTSRAQKELLVITAWVHISK